jgi:hypothetical protein
MHQGIWSKYKLFLGGLTNVKEFLKFVTEALILSPLQRITFGSISLSKNNVNKPDAFKQFLSLRVLLYIEITLLK